MELPFEAVAKLSSSSEHMVQCNGCLRILYLEDSLKGALVK